MSFPKYLDQAKHHDEIEKAAWLGENPIAKYLVQKNESFESFNSRVSIKWHRKLDQRPDYHHYPSLADAMGIEVEELISLFLVWWKMEPRSTLLASAVEIWESQNPLYQAFLDWDGSLQELCRQAGAPSSVVHQAIKAPSPTEQIPHVSTFEKLCPVLGLEVGLTVEQYRQWKKARPKNREEAARWVELAQNAEIRWH